MTVVVPGARPNSFDIQKAITLNSTFRAWTSTNVQVTRMSIRAGNQPAGKHTRTPTRPCLWRPARVGA
ncbi:hypothetical protein SAMN05660473_01936 [Arthrobacter sp. 49Tsu3.1M3]|uniref:hypothetical protein n=1 Tax=Arthrobacter sp. 49Tsu3.1M3 TaxID=1279029 RepID=UPI0009A69901|nr:hypothetical protein [Arthrobacter sp. 49Tsu3.1M3]SKB69059.1 hypothetical protein SAMN05660473_01936 [Arthrobacter sp. 49Tsu3.1M3]